MTVGDRVYADLATAELFDPKDGMFSPTKGSMSFARGNSDFQYLATHYFSHPSYLKIGQGRPVVFVYFSAALNPVPNFVRNLAFPYATRLSSRWFT